MDRHNVQPVVSRVLHIYDVMETVRERTNFIKDTRKNEYYKFLNTLNYKKVKLEKNLELLKNATAKTFDDSVSRVEETLNEINLFIKHYRHKLK